MKKKLFAIALLVCLCLPVFSQTATPDPLDAAIGRIYSDGISARLSAGAIAVRIKTDYPELTFYIDNKLELFKVRII